MPADRPASTPTTGADRTALVGSLFALVAATCFATLGVLSRWAGDEGLGPLGFVTWRAGIGAVAIAIGMLALGTLGSSLAALGSLGRRDRVALGLAGLAGLALNLAMFVSFGRISIALALLLFYTYPAMVAAVGVATGQEPLTPIRAAALAIASGGVILVLVGGLGGSSGIPDALGIALGLVAAVCQTIYMTLGRSAFRDLPAQAAVLTVLVVASVGAGLTAVVAGSASDLLAPFETAGLWPIVLTAGIVAAAVPSFLFLSAIRRIGGTRAGILMLWEPVFGVLLAALFLGETLGPVQLAGGVMVLAAAVILQVGSRPDQEPLSPAAELV